ncbi:MAG: hypothetical protein ACI4EU_04855 [Butyrivibrio sp.]
MTFKKLFKKVAAVLVAGATVVAMAVPTFAAAEDVLFTITVKASEDDGTHGGAKPTDPTNGHVVELDPVSDFGIDGSQVKEIKATFSNEAYFNGRLAGNCGATGKWDGSAKQTDIDSASDSAEFVWAPEGGLAVDADGKSYVKLEVWWMNYKGEEGSYEDATLTCKSVTVTMNDGTVYTYPKTASNDTNKGTAGSSTGDSANVGLILAVAAAVVAVGATVVLKKRETVER